MRRINFLFFRFCQCGHNAKGNGSPWCPISRKKNRYTKNSLFLFVELNNISILQHSTRGMHDNNSVYALLVIRLGILFLFLRFSFLFSPFFFSVRFFPVNTHTRELFYPRHLTLSIALGGFFLMRVEKMEKESSQSKGTFLCLRIKILAPPKNQFAFHSKIEFDFLISLNLYSIEGLRGEGKSMCKRDQRESPDWLSLLLLMRFSSIFTHAAIVSRWLSLHESLMTVTYCEVEREQMKTWTRRLKNDGREDKFTIDFVCMRHSKGDDKSAAFPSAVFEVDERKAGLQN